MCSVLTSSVIERSGFKPWPGTLCCVIGKTLYSHSPSLHLMMLGGGGGGGYPAMD